MTTLLRRIIEALGRNTQLCLHTTFADGSACQNREGTPHVKLHYKTAGAQWNTILFGHIGLLESYFDQTLDIEGDLNHAFAIGFESVGSFTSGVCGLTEGAASRIADRLVSVAELV